ncbi:MAG: DUF6359 domain-containing protein [Prevotella sp.]|nr:DUF6359 domain-containing protein [Prevotella sp.]
MSINKCTIVILAALFFVSCEKSVLENDGSTMPLETEQGGADTSDGDSGEERIYTVEEFRNGSVGDRVVWVKGYIVGACSRHIKNAEWEAPFTYSSAILLADVPGETDPERVISIQLVNDDMKEEFSLAVNPGNQDKLAAFYGTRQKYLDIFGMKKDIMGYCWIEE